MAAVAGVVSKHTPIPSLIRSCSCHGNGNGKKMSSIQRGVNGVRPLSFPAVRAVNGGGIEPDLSEEPIDYYRTPGVSEEDFQYGYADGAHTWHEGDDGDFKEEFLKVFKESGGPTGFQGVISWLFLPGLVGGMVFNVQGEYLYIYTALFVFAFIGIEMAKPDKPFNFEPKIYNMERKKRDKFMQDYNSMDIWEFNEKYKDMDI